MNKPEYLDVSDKAGRLQAFVGPLAAHTAETIEYWRTASSAQHAAAMIELSEYAEQMTRQTGFGKDADEMFPGFAAASRHGEGNNRA